MLPPLLLDVEPQHFVSCAFCGTDGRLILHCAGNGHVCGPRLKGESLSRLMELVLELKI